MQAWEVWRPSAAEVASKREELESWVAIVKARLAEGPVVWGAATGGKPTMVPVALMELAGVELEAWELPVKVEPIREQLEV